LLIISFLSPSEGDIEKNAKLSDTLEYNPNEKVKMDTIHKIVASSKAAIDLASIMVGVIVIGLIGGVIAATVFAVIPWAQDSAAKQQLESIVNAQNAYKGLSSDASYQLKGAAKVNTYASSAALSENSLLQTGATYCTEPTGNAAGYVGYSKSATGRVFTVSHSNTKPSLTSSFGCLDTVSTPTPTPETPASDVAKTSSFTINCPAGVTTAQLPIKNATGIATWSDGKEETYSNSEGSPRAVVSGENYTVKFVGTFNSLTANVMSTDLRSCIRSMDAWGTESGTVSAAYGFWGATNLTSVPSTLPASVKDVSYMFGNTNVFNQNLNNWDMSNVTTTRSMFQKAVGFNADISQWKLTSVKDAGNMFYMAKTFNQNLNTWDTSSFTRMDGMFRAATAYNQDMNNWKTGNVEDMTQMFQDATAFNGNVHDWDTTNVKDMHNMFAAAANFNQRLDGFETANVTDMSNMFLNAYKFNQNIGNWNVTKVKNFSNMFQEARVFNQNISSWVVTNSTNMENMFYNARVFNQNISGWDVANVTSYTEFYQGSALTQANIPAKFV
jgi:type II secretory pathway pseudopilin PulG